jgi:hypothetical protein
MKYEKKEKKTNPDLDLLLGRPRINKEPTQTYYWAGPESIKANGHVHAKS